MKATGRERVEHPVHRRTARADHRGEVGLGEAEVEHDPLSGFGPLAGEAEEQLREPPSEVEEDEVARLLREPSDQLPEAAHHGVEDGRVPQHGVQHGRTAQEQARRGLDGDDRCRAGRPVQEGDLPEHLTDAESGEHGLLARGRGEHDLDQTFADHEQRVAGVALVEHVLALAVGARTARRGELGQRVVVQRAEEVRPLQGAHDEAQIHVAALLARPSTARSPVQDLTCHRNDSSAVLQRSTLLPGRP
jgi:hypothetical protein